MLDTLCQIETPEGVFLQLRAAGALPRAQAWMIDFLLRGAVFSGVLLVVSWLGQGGIGIASVVMFLLTWFYAVVGEVWFGGQTLGKRAMGLRVVSADGAPVTLLPSVVRNLLRVVDIVPGVYGVGLISTLVDPHARRLGDVIAGTLVVHADELPRGGQVPVIPAEALPRVLNSTEQALIVEFAERCHQLTPQRQRELAQWLLPLTGQQGDAGVRRLVAYANDLVGRP